MGTLISAGYGIAVYVFLLAAFCYAISFIGDIGARTMPKRRST